MGHQLRRASEWLSGYRLNKLCVLMLCAELERAAVSLDVRAQSYSESVWSGGTSNPVESRVMWQEELQAKIDELELKTGFVERLSEKLSQTPEYKKLYDVLIKSYIEQLEPFEVMRELGLTRGEFDIRRRELLEIAARESV